MRTGECMVVMDERCIAKRRADMPPKPVVTEEGGKKKAAHGRSVRPFPPFPRFRWHLASFLFLWSLWLHLTHLNSSVVLFLISHTNRVIVPCGLVSSKPTVTQSYLLRGCFVSFTTALSPSELETTLSAMPAISH